MSEALQADLADIAVLVQEANLPEEQKRSAAWVIGQLPALYENFCRTYESRYGDEIVRLEQGILAQVGGQQSGQPVAESMAERFKGLHERLGLPLLNPKPPVRKAAPARKAARKVG